MVTDHQVRRLMKALAKGESMAKSADKAGMDVKTARRYRRLGRLPSQSRASHEWRTRSDAFEGVWEWVREQLAREPGLEAKTLLEALQRTYPGRFADGQLRTLERRVREWRGLEGPGQEVFFAQVHEPGVLCQSDFTHMTRLGVTIGGQRFAHLVYHFVLTYSNWEAWTICYSESFESLSEGLQNALWELGGVPACHRTDRLSSRRFPRRRARRSSHAGTRGCWITTVWGARRRGPAGRTRTGTWSSVTVGSRRRSSRRCCFGAAGSSPVWRPTRRWWAI